MHRIYLHRSTQAIPITGKIYQSFNHTSNSNRTLPATKQKSSLNTALPTQPNAELPALLTRAYQQATNGKASEWVLIPQLGIVLRKIDPSFKTKAYGQKDLSSLLKRYEDLFEIRKRNDKGGHLEVRLRKQAH